MDEFANSIKALDPKLSGTITILSEYMKGLENVSEGEDWTRYTEEILDVIQKSKVDNSMKANLRGAIIIALASSKLWNSKTLRK